MKVCNRCCSLHEESLKGKWWLPKPKRQSLPLLTLQGFIIYLFIVLIFWFALFTWFCFVLVWFGLVGLLWLFVWLLQQFTTVFLRFHGFVVLSFFLLLPRGVLVRSSSPCVMWGPFLPKVSPFFLPFLFGTSNCPYHFLRVRIIFYASLIRTSQL